MYYYLSNKKLQLTISSFGAEIKSIKLFGEEKLWQNEKGNWQGRAPVLFPFCSWFKVIHDGHEYPFKFHGIAIDSNFFVEKQTRKSILFSLKSNEKSKKYFPFDFIFFVQYTLCKNSIHIAYSVYNPTSENIYFTCGSHESYKIKNKLGDYYLEFSTKENPTIFHDDITGKYIEPCNYRFDGHKLHFEEVFFSHNDSLCLGNLRSKYILMKNSAGHIINKIMINNFHNLVLWRESDFNYICIENWHSFPDTIKTENIEYKDKNGVICVKAKSNVTLKRKIKYYY